MHRLVYVPPCLWPLKEQHSCGGYRPPFCTPLCAPLVCIPPFVCTALPMAPQITRLLRWLHASFCSHRLVFAPRCVCTGLYVHRLVYARTCMWTRRLANAYSPCASLARQFRPPACLVSARPPPPHLASTNPPPSGAPRSQLCLPLVCLVSAQAPPRCASLEPSPFPRAPR